MNINVTALLVLVAALLTHSAYAYFSLQVAPNPTDLPWVPIDLRKQRSFVNQTRDAGMFTERTRRTAIISNPDGMYGHKGSTNGSLEWNFLSSVCVCPARTKKDVCPPAPNVVWSDGDADDTICDGVDAGGAFGGYEAVDFGGAMGNECDV
jgi:hypothetical protein